MKNTLDLVAPEQRNAVAAFPPFDPSKQSITEFRRELVDGFTAALTPEPVDLNVCLLPRETVRRTSGF